MNDWDLHLPTDSISHTATWASVKKFRAMYLEAALGMSLREGARVLSFVARKRSRIADGRSLDNLGRRERLGRMCARGTNWFRDGTEERERERGGNRGGEGPSLVKAALIYIALTRETVLGPCFASRVRLSNDPVNPRQVQQRRAGLDCKIYILLDPRFHYRELIHATGIIIFIIVWENKTYVF